MFEIKYCFTENNTEVAKNVDEMTLRYELFLGSVWLEIDDKKISMDWKWIPLLDFALCLHTICGSLNKQAKGEEVFEFTESEATILFRREGDKCEVSASFTNSCLTMRYVAFQDAVQLFCRNIIADILSKNENLKANRVIKKIMKSLLL